MKKPILLSILALASFMFIQCSSNDLPAEPFPETVTDADGNIYNTIKIGDQIWMFENLRTTTFNDGTPISEYTFGNDWYNANNPFAYYQWADTSDLNNLYDEQLPFDFYGAMYNEASIASGKLAPIGWRIPTEQDFIELQNYISNDGQSDNEGTALKSTSGWLPSENNGTDIYGFNALPNGYVSAFGGATGAPVISTWATTRTDSTPPTRRMVNIMGSTIEFADNSVFLGAGVRCIKVQ